MQHLFLKAASGDTERLREPRAPSQSVMIKRDVIVCTGSRIKYLNNQVCRDAFIPVAVYESTASLWVNMNHFKTAAPSGEVTRFTSLRAQFSTELNFVYKARAVQGIVKYYQRYHSHLIAFFFPSPHLALKGLPI